VKRNLGRHLLIRGVVFLVVVGLVYLLGPLFHFVFYDMFHSPGAFIFWTITLVGATYLWFRPPLEVSSVEETRWFAVLSEGSDIEEISSPGFAKLAVFGMVVVVAMLLAGVYSIPANAFEERTLAQQTMGDADSIETFPSMNEENARIAPRPVADVQTRGSVSYRRYHLGTSDIARMEGGRLAWSYPIQPDGLRNKLFEHQQGVLVTDMTRMEDREIRRRRG